MATYGVKLQRSDDLRLDRHADACTEETFAEWCAERRDAGESLAVDLFSGAGGLSLGLQEAGWTVAVAVDNDPKALQTHRHNFPGLALPCDLGDPAERRALLRLLAQAEIDLVAGGPPCQPFSRAGRSKIRSLVEAGHRSPDDHRRQLWKAFLDVVLHVRPRAVLMENVPDMGLGDDFFVIRNMVDKLERAGYHTQIRLVDTWLHGVPQHRKRLILLARLDADTFTWPDPVRRRTALRDAIADLPGLGDGIGGRRLDYERPRRMSSFARRMRKGMPSRVVWDHMTRPVRDDDREIFRIMNSRMLYSQVPEHLRRYSAETFDDKYKRLGWDDLSRSITAHIAKDGYWYIHPEELRTLTVREAARIQTFPDVFRFAGTRSDAFRQIGNAVPPFLGEAAARALSPAAGGPADAAPSCWREIRDSLTRWARRQQRGARWFYLPGRDMTVAAAAFSAALLGRGTPVQGTERAVLHARGRDWLGNDELNRMGKDLPTATGKALIERARELTDDLEVWRDPEQLAEQLGMKTAQRRMFSLLCGEDVLLANQATIRVASRVIGSGSNRVNRMSNGRVDLARLIGAGKTAPLRAAALNLLGSTLCRERVTNCASCPLRRYCASADTNPSSAPDDQPGLF